MYSAGTPADGRRGTRLPWDQRLARVIVRPLAASPVTPNQIKRIRPQIEEQKASQQIPGFQILQKLGKGAMATPSQGRGRVRQAGVEGRSAARVAHARCRSPTEASAASIARSRVSDLQGHEARSSHHAGSDAGLEAGAVSPQAKEQPVRRRVASAIEGPPPVDMKST